MMVKVSDWCLTPTQQLFSYIMAWTSKFSMIWWWGPVCARPQCLIGLLMCYLTERTVDSHVASDGHIILIPSQPVFPLSP